MDIHVRRLRAKLGASLAIETLRGSGYRLRRDPPAGDVQAAELSPAFSAAVTPAYAAPTSYPASTSYPAPRSLPVAVQMPEPFSKVS